MVQTKQTIEFIEGFREGINCITELFEEEMIKRADEYFKGIESGRLKTPENAGISYSEIGLLCFFNSMKSVVKKIENF